MTTLLDALESPAADRSRICFVSEGTPSISQSEIASASRQAASWIARLAGTEGACAAVLVASADCLSVIFGAWRAGVRLVSVPHPARGMALAEYAMQVGNMCRLAGATHLLLDPGVARLMPDCGIPVRHFGEYRRWPEVGVRARGDAGFVQFTSGSTGSPKGVELSVRTIENHLAAILQELEPIDGEVVTSWLPISHDLGLIGACLSAYGAMGPPFSVASHLNLIRPETFLRKPAVWLEECSRSRTTITAVPGFALRVAARTLRARPTRLDLSSLRVVVVGSEQVDGAVLREFADAAEPYGFDPRAFCPGYGLAENCLAVSLVGTTEEWQSRVVSTEDLASGDWLTVDGDQARPSREIVGCGRAIHGTDVRIAGGRDVGEIEIRGDSMMRGYVGCEAGRGANGSIGSSSWFRTADIGHIENGSVFVVGRADDVIVVAGRNLDPRDLESVAERHPMVRTGNCVALASEEGRYRIVAEPSDPDSGRAALSVASREIRSDLLLRVGLRPDQVAFVRRGSIPKTPSGKVRRKRTAEMVRTGELEILATS